MKKSRRQLFREVLKLYLARHKQIEVTVAMDRVCGEFGKPKDCILGIGRSSHFRAKRVVTMQAGGVSLSPHRSAAPRGDRST